MTSIDKAIKEIRPRLRDVAPWTFWSTIFFGLFDIAVGLGLINIQILLTLRVIGIIPLQVWGAIFLFTGVFILGFLAINDWKRTRLMHAIGIAVHAAWLLEILAITVIGRTPFLLYIWLLIVLLRVNVHFYFTPRIERVK